MKDNRREQLIEIVKREFIGPDPIDWEGLLQENGEEILASDPPIKRYLAGVLFPNESTDMDLEDGLLDEEITEEDNLDHEANSEIQDEYSESLSEYLEDAEELMDRSNAYKPSALSITFAVPLGDNIDIEVNAGLYEKFNYVNKDDGSEGEADTNTAKDSETDVKAESDIDSEADTEEEIKTEKISVRYRRIPLVWNNSRKTALPTQEKRMVQIPVDLNGKKTGLEVVLTYRMKSKGSIIYTATLQNTLKKEGGGKSVKSEECFFQVKLKINSQKGFTPLPDTSRINADEDYESNSFLYRKIKNYAMGHGCAADWDSSQVVRWITSETFPTYEVKPIVPKAIEGVNLSMKAMSDPTKFADVIEQLYLMCAKYQEWIDGLSKELPEISEEFIPTANRHLESCQKCHDRMIQGLELLEKDSTVRKAFHWMNLAMLKQQLHYNLPLQKWTGDGKGGIELIDPVKIMPDVNDQTTWHDADNRIYGQWRPFQIAFVLMNLESMHEKKSKEREIVDLIWFPTGGGKTEAYLGLSAYTIFLRRLKNLDDDGTSIIMRYTLRLLTAQQYERASSLICACEMIRQKNPEELGENEISIGLWVGSSTSPNSQQEAIRAYERLKNGQSKTNPFVLLKCPWCGAEMGMIEVETDYGFTRMTPGYRRDPGPRRSFKFVFRCSNSENKCDFSSRNLPLYIIDEDIYENPPTLILGTVDKFAMLPFKPEAQKIFGYKNGIKRTSPDLIIQDELHLISGPLGSMVGHYETMIFELCKDEMSDSYPKVVASTATISRAKEQCHYLYGCDKENVFQFPPSGFDAGDSFFAEEDRSKKGRKYVGILATNSPSDATSAIWLYSALLYGAKKIDVNSESERDPYWTNVGYYNSIRELGQARTWIRADIDQHLDTMYKRRYDDKRFDTKEYRAYRRYIQRDEELTSRIPGDQVTANLANLAITYPPKLDSDGKILSSDAPIDIALATNMISVGLDVSRLGLMTVAGQPKTTSEYIQATSRVGRNSENSPGVIFTLYHPGRPRDKSYYEQFKSYHSKLYCNVEPTSVTPFSAPVRDRALHAIVFGLTRLTQSDEYNENPPKFPEDHIVERVKEIITNKIKKTDPEELDDTIKRLNEIFQQWEDWDFDRWTPVYGQSEASKIAPLIYPSSNRPNEAWDQRSFGTPTSMRSVDGSCETEAIRNRYPVEVE